MNLLSLTNQLATKQLLRSGRVSCFNPSTRLASSFSTTRTSVRFSPRATNVSSPLKNFVTPKRAFSLTPTALFTPSATMSDHGNVVDITSKEEFQAKVIDSKGPVVVDCFADWCGPCKAIAPKLAEFSIKYPGAKFYKIDVDQLADVAAELGVRAMPTFILFNNGEKVKDVVGANPPALEAGIQSLL